MHYSASYRLQRFICTASYQVRFRATLAIVAILTALVTPEPIDFPAAVARYFVAVTYGTQTCDAGIAEEIQH